VEVLLDPLGEALVQVVLMAEVEPMQAAEVMLDVEPMWEPVEELVARLVVQSVASLVAKLVVVVMTGIRSWALLAVVEITLRRLIGMLVKALASTASRKLASPGVPTVVTSSSYLSSSSWHSY